MNTGCKALKSTKPPNRLFQQGVSVKRFMCFINSLGFATTIKYNILFVLVLVGNGEKGELEEASGETIVRVEQVCTNSFKFQFVDGNLKGSIDY